MEKRTYIDKYFEGTLTPEEEITFTNLLKEDTDFASTFAFEKNVKKAITLNERKDLKKKLQSFENPKKSYKWLYVAASFTLLISVITWNNFSSTNHDSLYSAYYQTYPNVVAPTVRGENNEDIKSEAFFEYDNENYEKSVALFSKIYRTDKDDYALFYKALSLMELGKTNEAIAAFNQFDLSKNNSFTPFVKWYLALSYVKENQKEKAVPLLQSLSETNNPQQEMAKKIMSELE